VINPTITDTRAPITPSREAAADARPCTVRCIENAGERACDSPPRESKYILVFRNEGLERARNALAEGPPHPGQQGIHWFPVGPDAGAKDTRSGLMRSEASRKKVPGTVVEG